MSDMKEPKIIIVSMRSWGELGNYLCAKQLGGFIRSNLNVDEQVIFADDYISEFKNIGDKIKNIMKLYAHDPDSVHEHYSTLLKSLDTVINEYNYHENKEFETLTKVINDFSPKVTICTKGVIGKLLTNARSHYQYNFHIFNYVTNHGHFQFDAHVSDTIDGYLTRLPESTQYIYDVTQGKSRIYELGYISSIVSLDTNYFPNEAMPAFKNIIIVSNRGDVRYVDVLKHLSKVAGLRIIFISINNPEEIEKIEALLCLSDTKAEIEVFPDFDQKEYLKLIAKYGVEGAVYIGKGSINTLMEAVLLGIPVFGLRSGLPMEEWGKNYLESHGIGSIFSTSYELISALDKFASSQSEISKIVSSLKNHRKKFNSEDEIKHKFKTFLVDTLI